MLSFRPILRFVLLATVALATSLLSAQQPVDLQAHTSNPMRFIAYGDTRFTDPNDTEAANPQMRQKLVQAIADAHPDFISIGGDIAYRGDVSDDWKVWDAETAIWRDRKIRIFPVLGNHDLHGDPKVCLSNFFQRFPDLKESRYYSVRAANMLMLVLDSSQSETTGSQGNWLADKIDHLPSAVNFVAIILHHPPYTTSSDKKLYGGGHSARPTEQALAQMLESRQAHSHARFVVFSGHVHNYERHEHNGVTYFVTGGGGAHAYPIEREPNDPFPSRQINFHYLLVEVDHDKMKITMNRLDEEKGTWTQPDSTTISAAAGRALDGGGKNSQPPITSR